MKRHLTTIILLLASCLMSVAASKYVLVIDAGHGGKDAGAVGSMSKEKDINLKVALAFGKYVQKNCPDVNVIFTRKTDVFLELYERAEIANKNHADVFVSIHTNSLPAGHISRGAETYTMTLRRSEEKLSAAQRENSVITYEDNYEKHYEGFNSNSEEMIIMYEHIHDENMKMSVELAKCIQTNLCSAANRPNKGVKQDNFHVLRRTSMPACLVELGFISTPDEEAQLNNPAVLDKMAYGIYQGFVKYKNKSLAQADMPDDQQQPLLAATQTETVQTPSTPVVTSVPSAQQMPKSKKLRKADEEMTKNSPAKKAGGDTKKQTASNTQVAQVAQVTQVAKSEYNEQEEMARLQRLKQIEQKYQPKQQQKPQPAKEETPKPTEQPKQVADAKTQEAQRKQVVAATESKKQDAVAETKKQDAAAESKKQDAAESKKQDAAAESKKQDAAQVAQKVDTVQSKTDAANAVTLATSNKQPEAGHEPKDTVNINDAPVYKVQLLTCSRILKEGAPELKGLSDVSYYKDGNSYKFTIGECATIKDATALKKDIAEKFPDSFVIAMQNGKRIDINTALKWKKSDTKR